MEILVIIIYSIAGITTTYFTEDFAVSITKNELTDEIFMTNVFSGELNNLYVFEGPEDNFGAMTSMSTLEKRRLHKGYFELISKRKIMFLDREMIELEFWQDSNSLFPKKSEPYLKVKKIFGNYSELDSLKLTANQKSALGLLNQDNCPIGEYFCFKSSFYSPKFHEKGEEESLVFEVKSIIKQEVEPDFFDKYKALLYSVKH